MEIDSCSGAYLNVEYCFSIPPTVFVPRPRVDSAFIRFTKKESALLLIEICKV